MSQIYQHELYIAELAVQQAAVATQTVLHEHLSKGEISKADYSPVSIADFAAQVLIVAALRHSFPHDNIIAEETSSELSQNQSLVTRVWDLVQSTHLDNRDAEALLPKPDSIAAMLDLLDFGKDISVSEKGRIWTIDPIDGTYEYLRNGQYAVMCTLLNDGIEAITAIACPHVSLEHGKISDSDVDLRPGSGYIISAMRGHGAHRRPLTNGSLADAVSIPKLPSPGDRPLKLIAMTQESGLFSFNRASFAQNLGCPRPDVELYSTQIKYISLALGTADIYMRITERPRDLQAWLWDHAGGHLIFTECGGKVTDLMAEDLKFSAGRRLSSNVSVIASHRDVHQRVLDAALSIVKKDSEFKAYLDQKSS